MLTVNYSKLKNGLKTYMNRISDDHEILFITRNDHKNIVMLSEETYNNLLENIYVMGNQANYNWLMESKAQLEQGQENSSCP